MKEKYHFCENSGDWLYKARVPSGNMAYADRHGQCGCSLSFSVQGQIERGRYKKGKLEVNNQPSILRTDAFREHNLYIVGPMPW